MDQIVSQLKQEFPLPAEWLQKELVSERVKISGINVTLCGLIAERTTGAKMFASAAGIVEQHDIKSLVNRAYFELIERTATFEIIEKDQNHILSCSDFNNDQLRIKKGKIFPDNELDANWTYSKSNGIAAHHDQNLAKKHALFEVAERDRLLRSWFGEGVPQRMKSTFSLFPSVWHELYSFEEYLFPPTQGCVEPEINVVASFGFPKKPNLPLTYGFGARMDNKGASESATKEAIQRLGFLWEQEIPASDPPISPTPDFHQEHFLFPDHHKKIRAWLRGDHQKLCFLPKQTNVANSIPIFVDLTPEQLQKKLYVTKVYIENALPLYFGPRIDIYGHPVPKNLLIHPIA